MAITNLANTSWYLKENLDFTGISTGTYSIYFTTDDSSLGTCKELDITEPYSDEWTITYLDQGLSDHTAYHWPSGWSNASYRKIYILGGSSQTNSNLINFLVQNQVPILGNGIAT